MNLSVIIPTHNPRPDFLKRVLDALRKQTLDISCWELFLVDNASEQPLESLYDLTWHPHAFHVLERKLGLTPARLAGISRVKADVVVMVDDDNLLCVDYLELALKLADAFPFIGVWSGQIFLESEVPDSYLAQRYAYYFAERRFSGNLWTNRKRDYSIMPTGSGICARLDVLRRWENDCRMDPRRQMLGRTGARLLSCEDLDIVFTGCDMGYGKGLFHELSLTHLIPTDRLSEEFIVRNAEGNQYSAAIHNFLTDGILPSWQRNFFQQGGRLYRIARANPLARKIMLAQERGTRAAVRDMREWGWI